MKLEVLKSCLLDKNEENNCLQKHAFILALRAGDVSRGGTDRKSMLMT